MLIILITILFINIGCGKEEIKFDHKSQGWELWASGVVDKTYTKIESGRKTFFIVFEVQEKTKGSIYRHKTRWYRYYMWVLDEINNTKILIFPVQNEWQNIKLKQPFFDHPAIVKFENGLITIAYYERPGIWKAEMNRNKLSRGMALKNVVQWKLVDLK